MTECGKEHLALDPHEGCGHDEKLAGDLDVQCLQRAEVFEILLGDPGDRDLPDLDLVLLDQVEEKVKRPRKDLEVDRVAVKGGRIDPRIGALYDHLPPRKAVTPLAAK